MAQSWSRPFRVIMDPPLGEGERYNAEQSFQVRSMPGGLATISFTTAIKDLPRDPMARLPLLQFQPQGEAVFDPKLGLIVSARYASTGVVEGHQGEGSRYEFTSEYSEQLVAH
jgi:hypothetical protein